MVKKKLPNDNVKVSRAFAKRLEKAKTLSSEKQKVIGNIIDSLAS